MTRPRPTPSPARRRRALGATSIGAALPLLTGLLATPAVAAPTAEQPELGSKHAKIINVDGLKFRDLDGNGELTPYEDWRLTPAERAKDLVGRLDTEQKAGLLMHASLTGDSAYDLDAFQPLLEKRHITTYISRLGASADTLASEHNKLQELAEQQPFGIPILISTDPRSGFTVKEGQTVSNGDFTAFPDAIGMGATGDTALTQQMGDIIRQEYAATGMREALSPQADIATEPRWTRIDGTFGSVGQDVKPFVKAYIEGLQGGDTGLGTDSVATVVKHWVGYGAQDKGYDSHYYYGRYAVFPGDNFAEHIIPFTGAFAAGASGVMPTYSILKNLELNGKEIEQVGANHNEDLLQTLLRQEYKFKGVITSDWGIANDCPAECKETRPPKSFVGSWGAGMPWGVEKMTLPERYASAINAGVDIIGGSDQPQNILDAVEQGYLKQSRVDEAATAVLEQKFQLGLFENPYTDPAAAKQLVGQTKFQQVAESAQAKSLTLLQNKGNLLPLGGSTTSTATGTQAKAAVAPAAKAAAGTKVYLSGVEATAARQAGLEPVEDVTDADVAIVRLNDPRGGDDLTDLDFKGTEADFKELKKAHDAGVKTIAVPKLSRPLVLGNVLKNADAVIGAYGVSDRVLLQTVLGEREPEGKLPFELPSSMKAVAAQLSDVPNDSEDPLFEYGFGLSYADVTDPTTPAPEPNSTSAAPTPTAPETTEPAASPSSSAAEAEPTRSSSSNSSSSGAAAVAEDSDADLAATGATVAPYVVLAVALLIAGGAVVWLSARRRRSRH